MLSVEIRLSLPSLPLTRSSELLVLLLLLSMSRLTMLYGVGAEASRYYDETDETELLLSSLSLQVYYAILFLFLLLLLF